MLFMMMLSYIKAAYTWCTLQWIEHCKPIFTWQVWVWFNAKYSPHSHGCICYSLLTKNDSKNSCNWKSMFVIASFTKDVFSRKSCAADSNLRCIYDRFSKMYFKDYF